MHRLRIAGRAVRHLERRLCRQHFDFRTNAALVIDDFQCASAEYRRNLLRKRRTELSQAKARKYEIERR